MGADTNGYLIRPSRDEEFYILWSGICDDVKAYYASRETALSSGVSPERLERADATGSSCAWSDSYLSYDDDWLICEQQRLERADLKAYTLTCVSEGVKAAQAKFLTPIRDDEEAGA